MPAGRKRPNSAYMLADQQVDLDLEKMPDEVREAWGTLTPREKLFTAEFLRCLNSTEASKRSGYSHSTEGSHATNGNALKRKPEIALVLEWFFKQSLMKPAELLMRIGQQASATYEDFFDIDKDGYPVLNLRKAEQRGVLHLIKALIPNPVAPGGWQVVLHDSQIALQLLGKHYALFSEVVKHDGKVDISSEFTDTERAEAVAELLRRSQRVRESVSGRTDSGESDPAE